MQIHQPISHGLLYSVAPQDFAQMHLGDNSTRDKFDWEEAPEYGEESLANNVISFLKEIAGK